MAVMKNISGYKGSKRLMLAIAGISPFFLLKPVHAHCPLCTIGAVAAAGGAAYLGVSYAVIGVFIGAFAASMGWWFSNIIKKKFVPQQRLLLIIFSYLTTILPMLKVFNSSKGYYISLFGEYGSLLNRTYTFNPFIIGTLFGLAVISISPKISKKISGLRDGKIMPYQGISITFGLLIITSIILELMI